VDRLLHEPEVEEAARLVFDPDLRAGLNLYQRALRGERMEVNTSRWNEAGYFEYELEGHSEPGETNYGVFKVWVESRDGEWGVINAEFQGGVRVTSS
jgi:hypothetical protein